MRKSSLMIIDDNKAIIGIPSLHIYMYLVIVMNSLHGHANSIAIHRITIYMYM